MRPGPEPFPKRRLNPALRDKAREAMRNGRPSWLIAQVAGFPQPCLFSTHLHARRIKATPTNIERWQRVADAVGFDREKIFLDEAAAE